MEQYKLLTVTFKNIPLTQLGQFYIARQHDQISRDIRLRELKEHFSLDELFYLETCNRVVYFFTANQSLDQNFIGRFFGFINPQIAENGMNTAVGMSQAFEGLDAIRHLHEIAASLDSMVIGEREILRQLRQAYEHCQSIGLTGDDLRIAFKFVVPAAKRIYTETRIADRPVSVVSLAARELRAMNLPPSSRILLIGAGQTMQLMAKFLKPMGFEQITVFNRSLENGISLAAGLGGIAFPLTDLEQYRDGFDVLISCTGSSTPVITPPIFQNLLAGRPAPSMVIDLAIPADVHPAVPAQYSMRYIGLEQLREAADRNLAGRKEELGKATELISQFVEEFRNAWQLRQVERLFSHIPSEVRRLRLRAVEEVFAREIGNMDEANRETLDKVLDYLERKFAALPVSGARQALESQLKTQLKDGAITRSPLRRVAR